jgi:16S rRNA (cytosine1402-N4)-methyltransferase
MSYYHRPVLLSEVLNGLEVKLGGNYLDCTLGGAAYTLAISQLVGEKGKVISLDADSLAISNAEKLIEERDFKNIILVHNNFRYLSEILADLLHGDLLDGIVFDLGLSSAQLDDLNRGFSFLGNRPLDMAFGAGVYQETVQLVNTASLAELTKIFREYGEEPQAYKLAKAIVNKRRESWLKNTEDLKKIIETVIYNRKGTKINPATKAFQALRMATNDEINSLELALESSLEYLKEKARLVVVSFHSGEDRVVKQFFKKESSGCICPPDRPVCTCNHRSQLKIITKKPITTTQLELENNPRSRSAKLRIAEKI